MDFIASLPWELVITFLPLLPIGFLVYWLVSRHRAAVRLKAAEQRQAALSRAVEYRAMKSQAERDKAIGEHLMAMKQAADKVAERRLAAEKTAAERAQAEKAAVDAAIAEWATVVEDESRREAVAQEEREKTESEAAESRRRAVDKALAAWFAKMQSEMEKAGEEWESTAPDTSKKAQKKIDAIKEQVIAQLQRVEREKEDLEFIINAIETRVDFLPIEVEETIKQWKKGDVYKHHMLNDLKHKFRLKAYSIDDGWAVFRLYSDWIGKQRRRLLAYARVLGIEAERSEHVLAVIRRAEELEWQKHLGMDMDIIFSLKEMRDIYDITVTMEKRLGYLEAVCKKRSEQIIKPSWDPGSA